MNKDYKKTEIKEIDLKNVNGGCITTFVNMKHGKENNFIYIVTKEKLDEPKYSSGTDFGKDAKLFTDLKKAQAYADKIKVSKDGNTYVRGTYVNGIYSSTYQKK